MRLVRSLLDQLGGEIRVDNDGGAAFEITLPVGAEAALMADAPP
jgi:signal transduction histidine kinase